VLPTDRKSRLPDVAGNPAYRRPQIHRVPRVLVKRAVTQNHIIRMTGRILRVQRGPSCAKVRHRDWTEEMEEGVLPTVNKLRTFVHRLRHMAMQMSTDYTDFSLHTAIYGAICVHPFYMRNLRLTVIIFNSPV
jgi:hypothetical protein